MYGYFPYLTDSYDPSPPSPKTVAKAVIAAKPDGAASAMEIMRERAEKDTGKPWRWTERETDWLLEPA